MHVYSSAHVPSHTCPPPTSSNINTWKWGKNPYWSRVVPQCNTIGVTPSEVQGRAGRRPWGWSRAWCRVNIHQGHQQKWKRKKKSSSLVSSEAAWPCWQPTRHLAFRMERLLSVMLGHLVRCSVTEALECVMPSFYVQSKVLVQVECMASPGCHCPPPPCLMPTCRFSPPASNSPGVSHIIDLEECCLPPPPPKAQGM